MKIFKIIVSLVLVLLAAYIKPVFADTTADLLRACTVNKDTVTMEQLAACARVVGGMVPIGGAQGTAVDVIGDKMNEVMGQTPEYQVPPDDSDIQTAPGSSDGE